MFGRPMTLRRLSGVAERLLFHPSWFALGPQTLETTTAAVFSHSPVEQIAAFKKNGFALIRRSAAQSLLDLSTLESSILALTNEKRDKGWLYKLLRYFNLAGEYVVRSPEKRYSIPLHLGLTDALQRVLNSAVGSIRPLLNSQLSQNACLVDLASIISFPLSERQKSHSDVPFHAHKIIVGFVALSAVSMESGPTCLFAGSHSEAFHARHVGHMSGSEALFRATHYSPNGDNDISPSLSSAISAPAFAPSAADDAAVSLTAQTAPTAAVLEAGDIVLYNSTTFHFGGANVSSLPRALLMFSFQESTPWATISQVEGFTYNHDASVRGKFSLDSFV